MSIVPRTQTKCERGAKQTMGENILFNFLMCPYVSYLVNFIYNYKQRILNHIRYIRAHKFCVYQIEAKQTISTALFRFIYSMP